MKFKKGDRVIVTGSIDIFNLQCGEIEFFAGTEWRITLDNVVSYGGKESRSWKATPDMVELEQVYHSPLYKALS